MRAGAALLLVLLASPAAALALPHDDAGTGRDAPTTQGGAIAIPLDTVVQGDLRLQDAADTFVFSLSAQTPIVVEVESSSTVCYEVLTTRDGDTQLAGEGCVFPGVRTRVGCGDLAPGAHHVRLRGSAVPVSYALRVVTNDTAAAEALQPYPPATRWLA